MQVGSERFFIVILIVFIYYYFFQGYLLSKKALDIFGKKLIEDKFFCSNTGVEDQDISNCAQRLFIKQPNSIDSAGREKFHP